MTSAPTVSGPQADDTLYIHPSDFAYRGELYSFEHLMAHAVDLAGSLKIDASVQDAPEFRSRFSENAEFLKEANRILARGARDGDPVTPDTQWLLDNFYVVEEQLRQIHEDLPASYFRELPKLSSGEPRIHRLALELVTHTDSVLDQGTIVEFIRRFQAVAPLSIGEVWAIPIMFRLVLVENLRRLSAQMLKMKRCRETARRLADGWQGGDRLPPALDTDRRNPQLILQVLGVVRECAPDQIVRLSTLEQLVHHRFPGTHDLLREEHQRQAVNQVSVGNVITSMRLLSATDWETFFEETSLAEQILRRDPAGVYPRMDFESRDRYRHIVERLAKRSGRTDSEVAEMVVRRSASIVGAVSSVGLTPIGGSPAVVHEDPRSHVGYWLVGEGQDEFVEQVGYARKFGERILRTFAQKPSATFFTSVIGITVLGTLLTGIVAAKLLGGPWIALLLALVSILPWSEVAVLATNLFVTHVMPPRVLPKLELKEGVPPEYRTIVVIPSMLSGAGEIDSLVSRLEMHAIANPEPNVTYALLTDFTDADAESLPRDADLVRRAVEGIRTLNERYGQEGRGPFYLFHRSRRWNPVAKVWMGWERKRGKLMEFNALLRGAKETTYTTIEGDLPALLGPSGVSDLQFVITLDADTQLPFGTARKMIGTLGHILNRPQVSPDGSCLKHGYTILQPRVSVHLADGNRSWYSRIFAHGKGLDPYASAASDVYQDLFGEGSFTGKGIYDLNAFETVLHGAFPENTILSHDLIEGCHVRVGLVSDIELIDGFPMRYDADLRRQHRWVRGDWQIAPWLFGRVPSLTGNRANRLSILSKWKIFDNLRRSVVAPLVMALLILGWFLAPQGAWWWTGIGLLTVGFPLFGGLATSLWGLFRTSEPLSHLRASGLDLGRSLVRTYIHMSLLPHRALLMVDAIARTIHRVTRSRVRMLEWETAAAVDQRLGQSRKPIYVKLWPLPALAVALAFLLPHAALVPAAIWLVAWLTGPLVAHVISQPLHRKAPEFTADQKLWLRHIARKTWFWFECMVGPRTNWLPPDNFQEYPQAKLAERISPTNEGLYLTSALVARDFGFLSLHGLVEGWEKNLATWSNLEKFHGHFYNWYETSTLLPLRPRYISTVDSGNLAACFLVIKTGVADVLQAPIFGPAQWDGLKDTAFLVADSIRHLRRSLGKTHPQSFDRMANAFEEFQATLQTAPVSLVEWNTTVKGWKTHRAALNVANSALLSDESFPVDDLRTAVDILIQHLDGLEEDRLTLLSWADALPATLPLHDGPEVEGAADAVTRCWLRLRKELSQATSPQRLAALAGATAPLVSELEALTSAQPEGTRTALHTQFETLKTALERTSQGAAALVARYDAVAAHCESLALGMQFEFLYNPQRRLFAIGYNLEDDRLDRSHYDMLCSEARLTSFVAIAKGDVPARHWFQLGRSATYSAGQLGLLSWGGTMFEFLMPVLFQKWYPGSLIAQACQTAVARQRQYGHSLGIPWGVSESAFASLATNLDYQYQSFGVPGLGLKRGLSDDRVVAPYATLLALPIAPQESYANLHRLEAEGGLGVWGFYDAIEFTPERVPVNRRSVPVRCYMAHHQGMGLNALANVLMDHSLPRRFHAHPLIRASELLLQEKIPDGPPIIMPHEDETEVVHVAPASVEIVARRMGGWDSVRPRTHLLSNGRYSVMVTDTGGGSSTMGDVAVTRFRPDNTRDQWGQFLYLRDLATNRVWSPTYQPTCATPDAYEITYAIDKAEFRRLDGELETLYEVTVCPENQVEVRQLRLVNHGSEERVVEITSYAEIALCPAAADLAHPAFQKLFVETEYVPGETALIARRRPRDAKQRPLFGVHVLSCADAHGQDVQFETSRANFLGRGCSPRAPQALDPGVRLSGTVGTVLDPIFSLRCKVRVPAESSVVVAFTTGVAESRDEALRIADQYHDLRGVQRAFELAWAYNQVNLHHLQMTAARAQRFQRLASSLIFPDPVLRGPQQSIRLNRQGQNGLWRFGISGDRTILLVRVSEQDQVEFVQELAQGRRYWESLGLHIDLVVLNELPGSYFDELQEQLQRLAGDSHRPGGGTAVFTIRAAQITAEDRYLLESAAAIVVDARRGWANFTPGPAAAPKSTDKTEGAKPAAKGPHRSLSIGSQSPIKEFPPHERETAAGRGPESGSRSEARESLQFWNGTGGFTGDGREYRMFLEGRAVPPMPWSNVIANPRFGCLVTESGGGYTWAENSRENKLTAWSNDPVIDPPAEQIFIRDEKSGDLWTAVPGPRAAHRAVEVHHGQGYSRFLHSSQGLEHELRISIAPDAPVKFSCLKLRNRSDLPRELSVTCYAEFVLGVTREQSRMFLVTDVDPETRALLVRNSYHPDYPDQVAFLQVLSLNRSVTGDREEFWGRNAHPQRPAALLSPGELSRKIGPGFDPCGAIQTTVSIPAGEEVEVVFLLGSGQDRAEAQSLLHRFNTPHAVHAAMQQTREVWADVTETVQVKTPSPAMDLLVNHWLVYQVLSCRVWGRSAFYQSGGAYGFRDQLQDVMAAVYSRPGVAREQILRAAARQFVEGDVQHWWHPPAGRGTRTRFSDDLLWLPLVVAHYVGVTGDRTVLEEIVSFIRSPLLQPDEHERYEQPSPSGEESSVYDHCLRTLDRGFTSGSHGLPLMGCGDWNDGMNKVGEGGQGESVWVGWFLLVLLDRFLPVMEERGDQELAQQYRQKAAALRQSLESQAWDGEWYRRAFFDDGTPLGSRENDECQIDSLAQTWAVFAEADPERTDQALSAVLERLVDERLKLVKLFDPPFDKTALDPGYIKGYLPGVRENGGQYTHAVLWLIQALVQKGRGAEAMRIFDLINPVRHAASPEGVRTYQVEPYVVAADVYSVEPHGGRGGWTWYTGSAAWMYRAALESILGLRVREGTVSFEPCVPPEWGEFEVRMRRGTTTWVFKVVPGHDEESAEAFDPASNRFTLVEDGQEHRITVHVPNGRGGDLRREGEEDADAVRAEEGGR